MTIKLARDPEGAKIRMSRRNTQKEAIINNLNISFA